MRVADKLPGRERDRAPGGPGFEAPKISVTRLGPLHLRQGRAGGLEVARGRTPGRALEGTRALEERRTWWP